ncbi:thioesterase family protein [Micromonospora aurantiaca]|uniref:acyl-CoA thioesterase n=1 Tax=Micromonospora aurantiaca (nom. illeg.) TaxID=47850 RepID=UPI0033B04A5C
MTAVLPDETTTVALRPRFEGANIRTWVGFKHFMYLAEEAVLAWFRERGAGPSRLYHEHGLGLVIADASVQLPAVLDVDDEVTAEARHRGGGEFAVRLTARGVPVLRGRVRAALVRTGPAFDVAVPGDVPVVTEVRAGDPAPAADAAGTPFEWRWRAPYFYCQYSQPVQHSGYVRAVEEVVDRFLAARGISVGRMLDVRGWIPVVSRASVRVLAAARMEEEIETTFTVTDVLRGTMFDADVRFAVRRDGERVPVAHARILHGYAISRGPDAGRLAEFDDEVVAALLGTA